MQLLTLYFFAVVSIQHILAEDPIPTGKNAYCNLVSTKRDFLGKIKIQEVKVQNILAVAIKADLSSIDLADGLKGFHIHQIGKTDNDCIDAGPHFNPLGVQHGSPLDHTNRHLGDLGNIHVHGKQASISILDSRIRLDDSKDAGIIGRSIVLHELEDDLGRSDKKDSKTTGAAGARYACCVIKLE